ncbi:uncharacterized protein LOC133924146 [Phragmites australis]|uniref:uncharacterized protein LOC133924146 n=1 Tax=Phragmites australis TaxID=29695 RepID=UPI002D786F04|nr:uncharacterized protein LOC133924146 [Phragmites australis]
MDVFIHEDYVNKRNEVRREQRRQQLRVLQVEGDPDASRPAPTRRESPRVPAQCLTPTGVSSFSVRSPAASASPTAAAEEAAAWAAEHHLFDCLKPY